MFSFKNSVSLNTGNAIPLTTFVVITTFIVMSYNRAKSA